MRPGGETIERMGGLHGIASWARAILAGAGGFPLFSLKRLRKIIEGAIAPHGNGTPAIFAAESAVNVPLGKSVAGVTAIAKLRPFSGR